MSNSSTPSNPSTSMPSVAPAVGFLPVSGLDQGAFHQSLLDNLGEGVIFIDTRCRIVGWNKAIEQITGMVRAKVDRLELTPSLLGLANAEGQMISEDQSPVTACFQGQAEVSNDFKLIGRSGRQVKVEIRFIPTQAPDGRFQGAVVIVRDTSRQIDLQKKLDDLYEFSVVDPLTQVANRAELERGLDGYVRAHKTNGFPCSLIICDIDFFKQINDSYNHHVGDQALIAFAALLKRFVRAEDVVGRYGGEEFVILCANCDMESAVERAEEIRVALTRTPQPMLDGKCMTASFGVSQMSDGDSATDVFVRADNALLRAKQSGRNRVVEAGHGGSNGEPELKTAELTSLAGVKWRNHDGQPLIGEEFQTEAPLPVLVEKLRGYILESDAEIRCVESDYASFTVGVEDAESGSRKGSFAVDVEFQERETDEDSLTEGKRKQTFIRILVWEGKRKWFASNSTAWAPQVIREMCGYLMLNSPNSKLSVPRAATRAGKR